MGNSTVAAHRLLSTRQAAEVLSVSPHVVLRFVREGRLKSHRLGGTGHHRFLLPDLEAFVGVELERPPRTH